MYPVLEFTMSVTCTEDLEGEVLGFQVGMDSGGSDDYQSITKSKTTQILQPIFWYKYDQISSIYLHFLNLT